MLKNIPKGATVVFAGLSPGDQDFASDLYGGFNVSKAIRIMKSNCTQPILCSMSRSEITDLLSRRDINQAALNTLLGSHARLREPLIAAEAEPGVRVIIDGVHRLAALNEVTDAAVDPIIFRCYILPFSMRELIRIKPFVQHSDGRIEELDYAELLRQSWGKW